MKSTYVITQKFLKETTYTCYSNISHKHFIMFLPHACSWAMLPQMVDFFFPLCPLSFFIFGATLDHWLSKCFNKMDEKVQTSHSCSSSLTPFFFLSICLSVSFVPAFPFSRYKKSLVSCKKMSIVPGVLHIERINSPWCPAQRG